MSHIEVFAEIVCPFTHVELLRLVEARDVRGIDTPVRVRAWPLELINGKSMDPAAIAREVESLRAGVAPDLFRGFVQGSVPRTSLPAFGLAAAACEQHGDATGEDVSLALRDAVFEHGLSVGDPGVVAAIAERFAIVPWEAAAIEASVRADWRRGRERGVDGSPHFFVGGPDWFAPVFDISHDGDELDIHVDHEGRRAFYAAAFD